MEKLVAGALLIAGGWFVAMLGIACLSSRIGYVSSLAPLLIAEGVLFLAVGSDLVAPPSWASVVAAPLLLLGVVTGWTCWNHTVRYWHPDQTDDAP